MSRFPLARGARFLTVFAMLAALVVTGVMGVAAAPGKADFAGITANPKLVPYGTFSTTINADCNPGGVQGRANNCQVYVARNGAPASSEVLFANVTGTSSNLSVNFIADGCYNFRVYEGMLHTNLLDGVDVGHANSDGSLAVCTAAVGGGGFSPGAPQLSVLPTTVPNATAAETVKWDSGFVNSTEDSQVWILKNGINSTGTRTGTPQTFAGCGTAAFPSLTNEVLFAQGPSNVQTGPVLIGGGPYCFSLYSSTGHATKIAGPITVTTTIYLTVDTFTQQVRYNAANSALNAAVCVTGGPTGGVPTTTDGLFTYNSQGYGIAQAAFQIPGSTYTYTLRQGVDTVTPGDPTSGPAATACGAGSGTVVKTTGPITT